MANELRFDEALVILAEHEVEFIVVGGIAAILQGSPLTTLDLDILYQASEENHVRLASALARLQATYLDPAGRRIEPDLEKLSSMRIHLLETRYGRLDLLKTVGDDLSFEALVDHCLMLDVDRARVRVLRLGKIIETKEQANRPKDQYQLPFLRQLLAEIDLAER
jgi:hypothetical protein